MKKIFSFVSALFLSATLFAQEAETELFVAANASVDHTWGQFENPEATWDAVTGTFTIEIKAQAEWQWGNQVFLATGITTLGTNKEYQVSFDIVASTADCGQVTFKAFDDNQIAWANQDINVTDQVQRWTSEWTQAPAATTNGLMVWDFGWDPAQTVTITNISIKERASQAPAPYLFVDGIVTINELKDGETIYFQYFTYVDGKRVNGIAGNTISRKSFEPYTTEGYCEISYTNMDDVERKFITNPVIVGNVDSIFQGEVYLFVDTLLTTAGTYNRMIEDSTATLTLIVKSNAPVWPEDAPTTAPAAPTVDGASILGAALNPSYAFEPLDWPGAMPQLLTFETGETIYYMAKMTWQIYTNWAEDSYDMSEYNMLHVDLYPATGTEIKITIEGLKVEDGGQGYNNSVVKTLTAGQWNALDIALSEFPAMTSGDPYDFSDIRYFILEGYNAEQSALTVGNVYFYSNPTALPTLFGDGVKGNKFLHKGQLFIRKNGKTFNAVGAEF